MEEKFTKDIEELQEKFKELTNKQKELNDNKIRLETEHKNLLEDYNKNLDELKNITGTSTLKEAEKKIQDTENSLKQEIEILKASLDKYLSKDN